MPQIQVRDIRRFKPAAVLEVAQRLGTQRRRVITATDALLRARSAGDTWTGPAATEAAARHVGALTGLAELSAAIGVTASVLRRLAERMEASLGLMRRADRLAWERGAWIDPDGVVQVPQRFTTGDPTTDAHVGRLDALMVDEVRRCLAEAVRVAAATDADAQSALLQAAAGGGAPGVTGNLAVVPPPAEGADGRSDGAFANAAWWRSLTIAERRWVIGHRPEWVGSRDGIPAWDRHQANLLLLARARVTVAAGLRQARSSLFGVDVPAWEQAEGSIAAIDAVLSKRDGVTRHLLLVDISGPVVRAVTTVGNIDRAGHVATYVGGFSTSPQDDLAGYDERFVGMRRLAGATASGSGDAADVAIVLWMGYPAPQWRDVGWGARSVHRDDLARDWGDDLASFTNGIAASRDDPPHQTLWAHSYGSVVAGHALQHVMRMDDVALFGSPGTSLDSLAKAGLKPGGLNVLAAPNDYIAMSDWFARDPRDVPGVANLSAACALKPGTTKEPLQGSSGHSEYLDPGTTSEHNLAAIAAGRPELRVLPGGPCPVRPSPVRPSPGLPH